MSFVRNNQKKCLKSNIIEELKHKFLFFVWLEKKWIFRKIQYTSENRLHYQKNTELIHESHTYAYNVQKFHLFRLLYKNLQYFCFKFCFFGKAIFFASLFWLEWVAAVAVATIVVVVFACTLLRWSHFGKYVGVSQQSYEWWLLALYLQEYWF